MDRCALFVDASYVLADGAMAVHGTRRRESVSWDYAGLLQLLGNLAMERTRLPLLRCYWYEATVEGRRSADHDTLADLPGVKLRVAKMRPGRREGVESEIHRDLATLARNKAVSDVVMVSGEEDLAPVIADVQDMGMRVTLLQIAAEGNWATSRALRQECDDIVEVNAAHLRPYVELISGAEPPRADESEGAHVLRAPVNGTVNGSNGYSHGSGRPAAHAAGNGQAANGQAANGQAANGQAANGQAQGRPEPAAASRGAEYQQFSDAQAEPQVRPAPQPATADAAPADSGQAERPDAGDFAPAGDFAASLDYSASVDYGVPAEYPAAAEQGPAPDYRSAPEYGSAPDYQAQAAAVPAAPREDYYAAPVAVPVAAEEHSGEHERRPAARLGSDLPAYAPGAPRGQHQRDSGFRETDLGGDRLQPVPVAAASGSAQIRRLPTRGPGPAGPNSGQPLGLPPAPAPQPTLTQPGSSQPGGGQPGGPSLGPAEPGLGQPGLGQPGLGQPGGQVTVGQPTGGQPAVPVAPVVPMDQNGLGYAAARGPAYAGAAQGGGPRQVFPGPGGPSGLAGPGGNPGQGYGPAGTAPGGQAPAQAPGGQQDLGVPSGPIGLVGPGGYSGATPGASLADAVQSAHEEGQAFGESVARDAPALWLEAVLARKPRMPSDLEARLLQGSTLPIDFLLHDEVRHALRRGFWDALERARR